MAMLLWKLLLMLQIPPLESKAQTLMCSMTYLPQVTYEYHQFGDQIIGAMGSLFGDMLRELSFKDYPKPTEGNLM